LSRPSDTVLCSNHASCCCVVVIACSILQHISLAADLAAQSPRAHVLDQYLNPGNPLSHYDGTAEEILRQTKGEVL